MGPLALRTLFSLSHTTHTTHHPHSAMASTTNTTTSGGIVDTVKDAANYVSETVQEYTANASLGDRASAAFNAAGDKIDESQHSAKAEGYKKSAVPTMVCRRRCKRNSLRRHSTGCAV